MSETLALDDLPQPVEETSVPTDRLSVDGDNPNEQNDDTFGLLCENMRKHGWIGNAIVCDTDYVIADGEHRWRAAQEIDLEAVPVKVYDIDDATRRLWRQELNKISGEHDRKRDALEYDHLLDAGKSDEVHALTKAAEEDLDELLSEIKMERSRPASYEYDPDHNVYFEDCVEGMRDRLEDDSVDMVFTSPPYNVEKEASPKRTSDTVTYKDDLEDEEYREFMRAVFQELARVVKPTGHVFINHQNEFIGGELDLQTWIIDDMPLPLTSYIVWDKGGGVPTSMANLNSSGMFVCNWEPIFHFGEDPRSLRNTPQYSKWDISRVATADETGPHPAPFPVDLPARAITATTDPNDTVLDPFMGSGTTAVAAIQNRRNYVGFELDEEGAYKPIVERRIGEAKRAREATVNQEGEADE